MFRYLCGGVLGSHPQRIDIAMIKTRVAANTNRIDAESTALASALQRYRPKGAGIAKYVQLRQALLGAIEDGLWKPSQKLPTEAQLAAATPFSLGTVQSAYRSLVEHGVVVRIQGSGTFVAEGRHRMDAPWHCRFLDDKGTGYLPVYTKVLTRELTGERGPWSDYLGQNSDRAVRDLVRIDRKIGINDEFDVYSKFLVRADRFGAFMKKPLRELEGMNFKMLLSHEFGTPVTRLSQTLSVREAPAAVRKVLALEPPSIVTVLDIAAATSGGEPVYYQELYIPPNPRRLYVDDTIRR